MTDWPPEVAHLPRCPDRGLPIPFSSGRDAAGVGLFGANDPVAKLACALRRLCGLCGRPLGGQIAFLARGRVLARPVFTDPGMHENCCVTAMGLCPRIAHPGPVHGTPPGWVMWICETYELVPGRRSPADFLPGPAVRVRVFAYVGTALEEVLPCP